MLFCQSVLRAPQNGNTPSSNSASTKITTSLLDSRNTLSLAFYHRSQCLIELGYLQQAIIDLQLAQKCHPPDNLRADIFADLAQCYHVLGDSKKSKVAAELAKRLGKSKILINVLKRVTDKLEPVVPKIADGDGTKSNLLKLRETKEMGRLVRKSSKSFKTQQNFVGTWSQMKTSKLEKL